MGAMTATEPTGRPPRPLTVADLEDMPDDGHRYELLDGLLLVSPSPRVVHQYALMRLTLSLGRVVPDDLVVLFAPVSVRPEWWKPLRQQTTELQPDLLVIRRDGATRDLLQSVPLLVVEVLSPSTRLYDLNTKKAAYARMGVPDFWVVDVDVPLARAYSLEEGEYRLVHEASGRDPFTAASPFPVSFSPADLVDLPAEQ